MTENFGEHMSAERVALRFIMRLLMALYAQHHGGKTPEGTRKHADDIDRLLSGKITLFNYATKYDPEENIPRS